MSSSLADDALSALFPEEQEERLNQSVNRLEQCSNSWIKVLRLNCELYYPNSLSKWEALWSGQLCNLDKVNYTSTKVGKAQKLPLFGQLFFAK